MFDILVGVVAGLGFAKYSSDKILHPRHDSEINLDLRYQKRTTFLISLYDEILNTVSLAAELLDLSSKEDNEDNLNEVKKKLAKSYYNMQVYYAPLNSLYFHNTSLSSSISEMIALSRNTYDKLEDIKDKKLQNRLKRDVHKIYHHYKKVSDKISEICMLLWI